MEIFESLGIDFKLLFAQIINFGILVYILKRFLYTPVIERIEKDEAEIKIVERQRSELEKRAVIVQEEGEDMIRKSKRKAQEILSEAEHVATQIHTLAKQKNHEELQKKLLELSQKEGAFEEQIHEAVVNKVTSDIALQGPKKIVEHFSKESLKELQNFFIELAFEDIRTIPQKDLTRDLADLPISITTAFPLETKESTKVNEHVSDRIGQTFDLREYVDPKLIAGCRLEVSGYVINRNMLEVISVITK